MTYYSTLHVPEQIALAVMDENGTHIFPIDCKTDDRSVTQSQCSAKQMVGVWVLSELSMQSKERTSTLPCRRSMYVAGKEKKG